METIQDLKDKGYAHHHTAWTRGYISRMLEHGVPQPYKGRYGVGYTVGIPSYDSTRYYRVAYYIKR